jgi:hypothetical protein
MPGKLPEIHRLRMRLPFEISSVWDSFQHFPGVGGFAVVFSDKFVLDVHLATSHVAMEIIADFRAEEAKKKR